MIKTQVQFPDELYWQLKRVAEEREISLAEVIRRGAEYITRAYPPLEKSSTKDPLPGPFHLGLKGDPFSDPDWRYDLNERGTAQVVRERPPQKKRNSSRRAR
ncbi:MAG TPA: antitoxin [Kiritimatiellia bacterium]|mgnify:CR=1 FL=1|nr:antitoxin [Kiritimatiellia bacterium]